MRAALYRAFAAPLTLETVPDPEPPRDGVVIEVGANGVCRSDWHAWMGHDPVIELPHVPGHELAGTVVAVGSEVRRLRQGERVTVPFCCGCGRCLPCSAGHLHLCDRDYQPGFSGWGAFAQYLALPYADLNVVPLPDDIDFVSAAALGCRFMTAFWALTAQGRLRAGEWLAVHGCGGVGLSAVMIGVALGARVIAIDIRDAPLTLAAELGAEATVRADRNDSAEAVRELSGGGAQLSIDALGSPESCRASLRSLRQRGRHLQIGLLLAGERNPEIPMDLVIARELELRGSHGMPAHHYPELFEQIRAGRFDPAKLVTKRIALDEAGAELAAMGSFAQTGVTVIDRF